MSVLNYLKLDGTQTTAFQLAATSAGVKLKNNSGNLEIRNAADTADASIEASLANLSSATNQVVLGFGQTHPLTLNSGSPSATWTFTFPATAGSTGQVLQTDGSGNTSWVNSASGATDVTLQTALAFGSSATVSIGTLPANAVITSVEFIVDTAFDGSPTMSVGITASNSKYMGSGDSDLNIAAGRAVSPNLPSDASSEALNIYYSAGSSTTGAGRLLITYCVPA